MTDGVARLAEISTALSALYFGLPVYLVGSSVNPGTREPNDIDAVIAIPDALFDAMYGAVDANDHESPPARWRRWARDCAKQSRELTLTCRRFVDFKTQPQSLFDTYDKPRRRLDSNITGTRP